MKSILFRSIGASLFLLCLTFAAFADGEMGAGSKTDNGNGSGLAPNTTIQTTGKVDKSTTAKETENDFLGWIAGIFADILS